MRTKWQRVLEGVVIAALQLLLAQPVRGASPAETVTMQVEERAGFTRLSFPWHSYVDYRVSREGPVLTLHFDGDADFRVDGLGPDLLERVSQRREDGRTAVSLTLAPDTDYRYFRKGQAVVVDLLIRRSAADGPSLAARELPDRLAVR